MTASETNDSDTSITEAFNEAKKVLSTLNMRDAEP
jgi:hypothetical protein